jgi:hypothetical protein
VADQPKPNSPWTWWLAVAGAAFIGFVAGHYSAAPSSPSLTNDAALAASDANAAMASANAASNSAMAASGTPYVAPPPSYPSTAPVAVDNTDQSGSSSADANDSQYGSQGDDNLSNDRHYRNVAGDEVHSPAYSEDGSVPAGASAQCADGTYSFSEHRQGTCSHHGGVSSWE